jgi:hypothetical protein
MKTKQIVYAFSTLVLAGMLMLGGCKKKTKETEDPDSDQSAAQENQIAENMMGDVAGIGSQGSENGTLSTYKLDPSKDVFGVSSASLTFDVPNKTFTVDFGVYPGQTCADGRKRSGKLIFNYSASTNSATAYRQPGFHLSITSSNYTVEDYTVNIVNKTIQNTTPNSIPTGTNPGTNLTWSITANVNIIKPAAAGGGTITWNCNRVKTLLNTSDPMCYGGQGVPINWNKAKVSVSGSASGTTSQGDSYTAVLSGLTRDFGTCGAPLKYPFISGTLDFTPGTKATRYIDFGSGTCDRAATVTIKGITYSFNF